MIIKLSEIVTGIHHALETIEPLLFRIVLFLWATVEMGKFIWTVALGGGH